MPDINSNQQTSSSRIGKLNNGRSSVMKDSEHQTITLIPSHHKDGVGKNSLSNSIDVDLSKGAHLQSIDYHNTSDINQLRGENYVQPDKNTSANRYSRRGQSGRMSQKSNSSTRTGQKGHRQYVNMDASIPDEPDMVNFSPSNIEISNPL